MRLSRDWSIHRECTGWKLNKYYLLLAFACLWANQQSFTACGRALLCDEWSTAFKCLSHLLICVSGPVKFLSLRFLLVRCWESWYQPRRSSRGSWTDWCKSPRVPTDGATLLPPPSQRRVGRLKAQLSEWRVCGVSFPKGSEKLGLQSGCSGA